MLIHLYELILITWKILPYLLVKSPFHLNKILYHESIQFNVHKSIGSNPGQVNKIIIES